MDQIIELCRLYIRGEYDLVDQRVHDIAHHHPHEAEYLLNVAISAVTGSVSATARTSHQDPAVAIDVLAERLAYYQTASSN